MSVFLCNEYHISVLAIEIKRHNIDVAINGTKLPTEQIVKELYKTNLKSVNYCCWDNIPSTFIFDPSVLSEYKHYSPIEVIKAAYCFESQACKHPCYENTLASRFINLLIDTNIKLINGYRNVPMLLENSSQQKPQPFICNDYHINVLATEIKHHDIDFAINGAELSTEQIAEELLRTNLESVNYHHKVNTTTDFIFYQSLLPSYKSSPMDIINAAYCYQYQSCKHPNYENTLANKFIRLLIRHMVELLPDYKNAKYHLKRP